MTEKLRQWRKDRNITEANTEVLVENILEELLEIYYKDKEKIKAIQKEIMEDYFLNIVPISNTDTVDALQDIQIFAINETELMNFNNLICNEEVFKHIDSRKQDPEQFIEWQKNGAVGKWKKWANQPKDEIYEPNYTRMM